jgi:acetylglutamate kinase
VKALIKLGGTLLDEPSSRESLARQLAAAQAAGHHLAIVHGGGRQLTRFLEAQGVVTRFVDGLRVTTEQAIDAVIQILAGLVNKRLVAALRAAGANPVGISGLDGRLTTATELNPELGWVGKITAADARLLNLLTAAGHIPVVACVSGDDEAGIWNVNADQMAAACARAFDPDKLIFLTDVAGVLDADGQIIPSLSISDARHLMITGVAQGGMQAKLEAACSAIEGGIASVIVAGGARPGIIDHLLCGEPQGTFIYA